MRYKFYREHKYISFVLTELERLIAKTDFANNAQKENVQKGLDEALGLLKAHAAYEDERLHPLLKSKNSPMYEDAEDEHEQHDIVFRQLQTLLAKAHDEPSGDEFYRAYRKFVGNNLLHFEEEEAHILPELHRLYTDKELKTVEFDTYRRMTPEQMIHMIQTLFPHMNPYDHQAFLSDIKESEPEKFKAIWPQIK